MSSWYQYFPPWFFYSSEPVQISLHAVASVNFITQLPIKSIHIHSLILTPPKMFGIFLVLSIAILAQECNTALLFIHRDRQQLDSTEPLFTTKPPPQITSDIPDIPWQDPESGSNYLFRNK